MYYFLEQKYTIEKYFVSFSKEELEKLKIEIINKCSEIEHYEYDGTEGPNKFDYLQIRNYHEKFIRIRESRDNLQWPDQKLYHYSYDKYNYPTLVTAIDNLLNGNVQALDVIYNQNSEITIKTIDERITETSGELTAIDNLNITEKKEKLNNLQRLVELKELNKNQKSVIPYYDKVRELITLEYVDSITKEVLEKVNQFFENRVDLNKQLKKTKILKN